MQAGVSELASGYGVATAPAPASGAAPAVTKLTRLLKRARRGLDATRLRALLRELRGCLTTLPARSQKVLLLRAGLIGSRPLSVRGIAIRLHISPHRVVAEEIAALRKLRTAVQTSTCAVTGARHPFTFTSYVRFPGAGPLGNGGVADALYLRAATQTEAPTLPDGIAAAPPGVTRLNAASSVPAVVIIGAAVALLVGLLAVDSLGVNPLRRRFNRRHRR
jgi:hypothetical protein